MHNIKHSQGQTTNSQHSRSTYTLKLTTSHYY